jgi:hypothetical protein
MAEDRRYLLLVGRLVVARFPVREIEATKALKAACGIKPIL